MPMVSARLGAVALAFTFVVLAPDPAARAFGVNFGPLHVHLPFPGGAHRHRRIARTEPTTTTAPATAIETAPSASPTLLSPVLAWPSLYDAIFQPRTSSWPFGYQTIFDQAFTKYSPQRASDLCPYRDTTAQTVMQITRETAPTDAQKPLLQKLATALGQANGYLAKSCPREIPTQPVARLQLMEAQIDAAIMALDIVRPQLQKFEHSLDDKQRVRLDGAEPAADTAAAPCKPSADTANGPLSQLEQAVQPTDAQREAFSAVRDAFKRAATDLNDVCPSAVPRTALGRLESTEARLDATWRAVLTIEVALENFQKGLSNQQNDRFNALEIASAR